MAIVGPTASGKTSLALRIARAIDGVELVSVDAMSVYKHMDIGTAKPMGEQRVGVKWHLIDLVEPTEEFSVAQFQASYRSVMADIERVGHRAILVGGTGLYHRAVIDNLELPGRFEDVAADLAAKERLDGGLGKLYAQLIELDPVAGSRILPTNSRRILRALEVTIGSGRPFSSFGPGLEQYDKVAIDMFGLALKRSDLDTQIEKRLDSQLEGGFIEEVQLLMRYDTPLSRTAAKALGYSELASYLAGEMSLDQAREFILGRTRSFARRQEAWFRRDWRVTWLYGSEDENFLTIMRAMSSL